jgi:sec-independent protein translocase protein TatA
LLVKQRKIKSVRDVPNFSNQKKDYDMNATLLFLGNLGATEFVLIFLVVLLLFGGQKIPELMRGLGRGIREFNNAKNSVEDEIRQGMRDAEKKNIEK